MSLPQHPFLHLSLQPSLVCSGVISGTGGVWVLNSGSFTLSGANTYTGFSIVFDGSVWEEATLGVPVDPSNSPETK